MLYTAPTLLNSHLNTIEGSTESPDVLDPYQADTRPATAAGFQLRVIHEKPARLADDHGVLMSILSMYSGIFRPTSR